jgi:hypothetical protein
MYLYTRAKSCHTKYSTGEAVREIYEVQFRKPRSSKHTKQMQDFEVPMAVSEDVKPFRSNPEYTNLH